MGKKNKKKLRKILRQQLTQQSPIQSETPSVSLNTQEIVKEPMDAGTSAIKIEEKEVLEQSEDGKEVKHEIKKIILTMLALFAIIVGVYFINIKTDIILKFGSWATTFLNIKV